MGRKPKGLFRGVRVKSDNCFVAEFYDPKKKRSQYLGTYSTAKEAALAFDAKAREYHGPNASTNFDLAVSSDICLPKVNSIESEIVPVVNTGYSNSIFLFCDSLNSSKRTMSGSTGLVDDVAVGVDTSKMPMPESIIGHVDVAAGVDTSKMPMPESIIGHVDVAAGVGSSADASAITSMPRRGLDIDLNLPPPPEI
ncbi:hypothetical protein FRX31_003203 [Thalictrum thalictroides]|uniref:AP2/ERF domain-containing protein n=1 Tax=Thalictrum thalictroides TaxID=46969 RepID=A0A7J6XFN7_THATH|nr:hypothetical protein FRX31_003203 [Thalictrum thalictroides]